MNLDDLSEEDLGKHLDAALRQALGGSLQINIGKTNFKDGDVGQFTMVLLKP